LISKDIKSIGGATFKSLVYSYFKEKDGKILSYVQATFEVAGTTHSENFSFELREDKDFGGAGSGHAQCVACSHKLPLNIYNRTHK